MSNVVDLTNDDASSVSKTNGIAVSVAALRTASRKQPDGQSQQQPLAPTSRRRDRKQEGDKRKSYGEKKDSIIWETPKEGSFGRKGKSHETATSTSRRKIRQETGTLHEKPPKAKRRKMKRQKAGANNYFDREIGEEIHTAKRLDNIAYAPLQPCMPSFDSLPTFGFSNIFPDFDTRKNDKPIEEVTGVDQSKKRKDPERKKSASNKSKMANSSPNPKATPASEFREKRGKKKDEAWNEAGVDPVGVNICVDCVDLFDDENLKLPTPLKETASEAFARLWKDNEGDEPARPEFIICDSDDEEEEVVVVEVVGRGGQMDEAYSQEDESTKNSAFATIESKEKQRTANERQGHLLLKEFKNDRKLDTQQPKPVGYQPDLPEGWEDNERKQLACLEESAVPGTLGQGDGAIPSSEKGSIKLTRPAVKETFEENVALSGEQHPLPTINVNVAGPDEANAQSLGDSIASQRPAIPETFNEHVAFSEQQHPLPTINVNVAQVDGPEEANTHCAGASMASQRSAKQETFVDNVAFPEEQHPLPTINVTRAQVDGPDVDIPGSAGASMASQRPAKQETFEDVAAFSEQQHPLLTINFHVAQDDDPHQVVPGSVRGGIKPQRPSIPEKRKDSVGFSEASHQPTTPANIAQDVSGQLQSIPGYDNGGTQSRFEKKLAFSEEKPRPAINFKPAHDPYPNESPSRKEFSGAKPDSPEQKNSFHGVHVSDEAARLNKNIPNDAVIDPLMQETKMSVLPVEQKTIQAPSLRKVSVSNESDIKRTTGKKDGLSPCRNFVVIDGDDEIDDEWFVTAVKPSLNFSSYPMKTGKKKANTTTLNALPAGREHDKKAPSGIPPSSKKPYVNWTFNSDEAAAALQDRLFRECTDRMRTRVEEDPSFLNTVPPRPPAAESPSFASPMAVVHKKYPQHWRWRDPYARLGLPRNASTACVKSHYRKLALVYHPDKLKAGESTEPFHAITAAYRKITT